MRKPFLFVSCDVSAKPSLLTCNSTSCIVCLCSYEFNDKEVNTLIEKEDELLDVFKYGCLEDFVPGLRYVYKTNVFKQVEEFTKLMIDGFIQKKFLEEEKSFDRGINLKKSTCIN